MLLYLSFLLATALGLQVHPNVSDMSDTSNDARVAKVTLKNGLELTGGTDGTYDYYLGIPYADAPMGALRFKKPVDYVPRTTKLNATQFGNACMQPVGSLGSPGMVISEDCLNLNVFVPRTRQLNATFIPVAVYIHGGGFNTGYSANPLYHPQEMYQSGMDVIIVSFNYRLGAFGFLASKELEGQDALNLGLFDQIKAFEWIHKNIYSFGGNPQDITVFGQSAGAISIGCHLLWDKGSQCLFDRAALYSGAPLLRFPTVQSSQPAFDAIAQKLNCGNASESTEKQDLMTCIANADANLLLNASMGVQFGPVLDKHLNDPMQQYNAKQFSQVPLLLHSDRDEGTYFTYKSVRNNATMDAFINKYFALNATQRMQLDSMYPADVPFKRAGRILGDYVFECPMQVLQMHYAKQRVPVRKLKFIHEPAKPLSSEFKALGVYHGSEVPFLWRKKEHLEPDEEAISTEMYAELRDFIRNGNATVQVDLLSDECNYWLSSL